VIKNTKITCFKYFLPVQLKRNQSRTVKLEKELKAISCGDATQEIPEKSSMGRVDANLPNQQQDCVLNLEVRMVRMKHL